MNLVSCYNGSGMKTFENQICVFKGQNYGDDSLVCQNGVCVICRIGEWFLNHSRLEPIIERECPWIERVAGRQPIVTRIESPSAVE